MSKRTELVFDGVPRGIWLWNTCGPWGPDDLPLPSEAPCHVWIAMSIDNCNPLAPIVVERQYEKTCVEARQGHSERCDLVLSWVLRAEKRKARQWQGSSL